ncbi:enoyl-CoA hydratase/isomerase family protein [Chelativorans salis]|uniref:3-hydroxyisobutyryl-CoA hydrolase n=1 Tax=Chelativorans salis TaxID=2978478 RepID=A0ABT2LMS5_9HYPH|nr:enoyl-CoA hydratase/isomerase family protein [Chelativorans sp. EGI FJ00035]MCT7375860.1 enoyl-CoA hydratase/isomerase family protein [Chelativorans sp. EGI FJ00035]
MEGDFGGGGDIRFVRQGCAGVIVLDRPAALNSLTHSMVKAIGRALTAWQADDEVRVVLIKGEGRAFCAGGDILAIYEAGRAGRPPVGFFADEYRLNAAIARFSKPYVALIDGVVMGGGVGVSAHGSHRVMTEKTLFAMPEVGIGFFPDVGGSHLLSRLPGHYGMYLVLTGERIGQGEALGAGLATHAVDSTALAELADEIAETGDVDAALAARARDVPREKDGARLEAIARYFSPSTLEECVASLSQGAEEGDEFAAATLETIAKRSPTSLHVAFRQLRLGAALSMDECMRMEFRIVNRMLGNGDFYEGIRAAIVDKTKAPAWQPASLDAVDPAAIEAFFAPLPDGELEL